MGQCPSCNGTTSLDYGLEETTHGLCHPCASGALEDVLEVLAPFAFHAKALGVMKMKNPIRPISKKGVSALCVGAFQNALETFKKYHPGWGEEEKKKGKR